MAASKLPALTALDAVYCDDDDDDDDFPNRDPCFACKMWGYLGPTGGVVCRVCRGNGVVLRRRTPIILGARNRRILGRLPANEGDWPSTTPTINPVTWMWAPKELREAVKRLSAHWQNGLRRDAKRFQVNGVNPIYPTFFVFFFTKKTALLV